jgi:hypothetical protein
MVEAQEVSSIVFPFFRRGRRIFLNDERHVFQADFQFGGSDSTTSFTTSSKSVFPGKKAWLAENGEA